MNSLLQTTLRSLPVGPLHTLKQFTDDPIGTQTRLLRGLLVRARDTEWGRRYGFADLAQANDVIAAYQARVPLHGYEDYRADVTRIRQQVPDVTWPGTFRHFAVSSGTASAGKIIPVSEEMLLKNRQFSMGAAYNYLAATGDPRFWLGKFLSIPGRIEPDTKYPGTVIGEVSGLQAEFAPAFVKYLYQAVPNEVLFMPHWERKLDAIIDATLDSDIRAIAMVPSWAIVLFRRLLNRYNEKHGTTARTVTEVWPHLQVFFSGGVALSSYRALLEAQIGNPNMHFIENYGASEGFFSFQTTPNATDMLLHLDNGVFFEFVRMEEMHDKAPRRYTIGEVEPDVRYALYVTTCSGLWAYSVGDVVRFTETRPHKIVVAGRTSEMIDKYGEAVFGEEARQALEHACAETGARVQDYHIAPRPPGEEALPAHEWFIEFTQPPPHLEDFSRLIDGYLQEINRHYQIRREAHAFEPPLIIQLPRGTFYAWLDQVKAQVSAQSKVPRMREDRSVADALLQMLEK